MFLRLSVFGRFNLMLQNGHFGLANKRTTMDNTIDAPATNSGRMLKTSEGRERSLSEERVKFMEEECDVWDILLI